MNLPNLPVLQPLLVLLHSRKFIVAVVSVISFVISAAVPALADKQGTIAGLLAIVSTVLILGISIEDAAALAGSAKEETLLAAVQEIVTELITEFSKSGQPKA